MNTLLLFFAFPIAVIILSIVLEKIIRCPFLTAATFFAIFLIVAFAVFDASFLIFVISYTILSFLVAYITERILQECGRRMGEGCHCLRRPCNCCRQNDMSQIEVASLPNSSNLINTQNAINNQPNDIARVRITNNNCGRGSTWCCYRKN